jgi:hypothetical protein
MPVFSTKVPVGTLAPTGNTSSIDFGIILDGEGGRAIDLAGMLTPTLGSMDGFTATGWLNSADLRVGWGGNRILFGLASPNGPGFDIVQMDDGSLQIGVNQWPDNTPARSSPGYVTLDPELGDGNWVFFAVTYDGTQALDNVKFYFGNANQEAQQDVIASYDRGPILQSGSLTVGNFGANVAARDETGPTGGSRVFRGLMDELNVFNRVLTLEEIQAVQKAPANAAPVQSPSLAIDLEAGQIVISWDSSANYQLQQRQNLSSGTWADEATPPVVNGTQKTVTLPATAASGFYRLIQR